MVGGPEVEGGGGGGGRGGGEGEEEGEGGVPDELFYSFGEDEC